MRRQLHADPDTRRRRQRTLVMAALQLVLAVLLIRLAYSLRVQVGPHSYTSGPGTITLVISGILMLGTSLVLFVRSPFRMPIGERFFRVVWLGPIGRGFLRLAARGTAPAGGGANRTTGARAPAPAAVTVAEPPANRSVPSGDRVGQLEARVAALEEWRDSAGSKGGR
jgi:hypothetical protein